MHSSARIDRQLVGRAARQGDPGSCQVFVSLGDELLRVSQARKARTPAQISPAERAWRTFAAMASLFRRTQRFLERLHRKERKMLLRNERQRTEAHQKMGLDPFLELTD